MRQLRGDKEPGDRADKHWAHQRAMRRLREDPLDAVTWIAGDIGPRRATSLGEAQVAAYLDGRLRRAGLRVMADAIAAPASTGWGGVLLALFLAAGVTLYYWVPLPSLALAVWCLGIALWRLARPQTPLLARRRASQNVIGTRATTQSPRLRVVLLAPLDSPLVVPRTLRWLTEGYRMPLGRAVACGLVVLFALVGLFDVQRLWWYAQFVVLVYLVLLALVDLYLLRAPASPGAVSHGGALAVLLSAAESLTTIEQIELWAIGLGATASGNGVRDVLRRYPFEPENTLFIGLEGIGSGRLTYVTREGFPAQQPADPELLRLAAAADAADPLIDVEPRPYRATPTIAGALRRAGCRSLTVTCLDENGRVPYRGSSDDTPAVASSEVLNRAVRLVTGMVRQIDAEATAAVQASRAP